jgi:hypothetical protein
MHKSISQYMKSVSAMCRPPADRKIKHLDFTGRSDDPGMDPDPKQFQLELPFEPIFRRSQKPGHGPPGAGLVQDFGDLKPVLQKCDMPDEEEELRMESMRVVDGWREFFLPSSRQMESNDADIHITETIPISSSPVPTPRSSQEEYDQLQKMFLRSSPDTEVSDTKPWEDKKEEIGRTHACFFHRRLLSHCLAQKYL